jgi:hypothetical protein
MSVRCLQTQNWPNALKGAISVRYLKTLTWQNPFLRTISKKSALIFTGEVEVGTGHR